jgi:carboxypeptidase PM20D1
MVKRTLFFSLVAVLILATVLLVNTFRFVSKQVPVSTLPPPKASDESINHFHQAISFRTISYSDSSLLDSSQFLGFHKFLEATYPLVHKTLACERVRKYSLLYTWEGKNQQLNPIVLMAHQDVVPIEEATKTMWTVDPFAGEIKNNFIWGRGTTDDKINLISIFESVEKLLKENFQPDRTIYLAFGHDEETGGKGAKAIAALLKLRNIHADLVLDEGGIITTDKIPGMTKPVALIGNSEKGYLSLELTAEKSGGHSSQPEKETSIDMLAKAIIRIRENPFDASLSESTQGFLDHLGPEMPFFQKLVFANQWLFKGVIISTYEKSAAGNAVMRTTAVPTIIHAGIKDNVVPTIAKAIVNFRLLPGDESKQVVERVKKLVDDERISLKIANTFVAEASPVTPIHSFAFQKVNLIIRKVTNNTITVPFMMIGGTDSRHFGQVSPGIIKFSPMIDPVGFHGIDEHVSLESFGLAQWFYEQLLSDLK